VLARHCGEPAAQAERQVAIVEKTVTAAGF
jgi:hypothetical protein